MPRFYVIDPSQSKTIRVILLVGLLLVAVSGSVQAETATSLEADLELSLALSTETATFGDLVTITVLVFNYGPRSAQAVVVHYRLPEGLAFASAAFSDETDTYDPATGRWTVGTISRDMLMPVPMMRVEVTALVTATGPTEHIAEVIASSQPDPDSTPANDDPAEDDYARALLQAEAATVLDLQLTLEDGGVVAQPGQGLLYTLRYLNADRAATGVVLTETLPAYTRFDAMSSTAGWTSTGGDQYQLTLDNLEAGTSGIVVFAVVVDTAIPETVAQLTNTASITDDGSQGTDATPENNTATTMTPLARESMADLSLVFTTSAEAVSVGEEVALTMTLTNAGPSEATGVVVDVALPSGLALVSHTGEGTYEATTGLWTLGTVPVGVSRPLVLQVEVLAAGLIETQAFLRLADQPDPDSAPGSRDTGEDDEATVTVEGVLVMAALTSPLDGTRIGASLVDLAWEAVPGASSYEVAVAIAGQGFAEAVFAGTVEQTRVSVAALTSGVSYAWRVRAVTGSVVGPWSLVWVFTVDDASVGVNDAPQIEASYELTAVYPNPFNEEARFTLSVPQQQEVTIAVYDMLGQRRAVLYQGRMQAQRPRSFAWRAAGEPSGVYVIRVVGERFVETRQVTLVK